MQQKKDFIKYKVEAKDNCGYSIDTCALFWKFSKIPAWFTG